MSENKTSIRNRVPPSDEGHLSEQISIYKKGRAGYTSDLTKTIEKIEQCLIDKDNKRLQKYDLRLDKIINDIREVTTNLYNITTNTRESEEILNF